MMQMGTEKLRVRKFMTRFRDYHAPGGQEPGFCLILI